MMAIHEIDYPFLEWAEQGAANCLMHIHEEKMRGGPGKRMVALARIEMTMRDVCKSIKDIMDDETLDR